MASGTKERILNAAERLFADSGLGATSLRDITSEAAVNLAAVNYHFGSKEALLKAVLERRFRPINERRISWLDELENQAGENGPALEDILLAFLGPSFDAWTHYGDSGQKFLRLVGQIHTQPKEEIRTVFVSQFDQVLDRYTKALMRALPSLDPDEVRRRMFFVVGAMAQTMIWGEQFASRTSQGAHNLRQIRESLVRFAAAGFAAEALTQVRGPVDSSGGQS